MKLPQNPIRLVAVVCVAVTSAFVMRMSYLLIGTLSGPDWCRTALGAGKASSIDGTVKGLDACVGLLTIQLKSLAMNSYIFGGVIAGCLAVLVVIVIAGAKAEFEASTTGIKGNVSHDDAPVAEAVQAAADGLQEKADALKAPTP